MKRPPRNDFGHALRVARTAASLSQEAFSDVSGRTYISQLERGERHATLSKIDELADKARAVRIPVHMLEAQQQLEKVRQALVGELGRPPTPQELAKAARVPLAKLNQMHRYIMGQPMSLDRPVHDDDDRSFGDTMADPDSEEHSPADELTTQTLTSQIKRLLHYLSPIEADVLTKRFGLGDDEERTFREIGDQYHLSRERIRQIQNSALDKLKRALEREHRGHVDM